MYILYRQFGVQSTVWKNVFTAYCNILCLRCIPMFMWFFSSSFLSSTPSPSHHSAPIIRSCLSAGISHFPAAAGGEARHAWTSALRKENGAAASGERRQRHTETGLPTGLQHAQMYDYSVGILRVAHVVSAAQGDVSGTTHPAKKGWT